MFLVTQKCVVVVDAPPDLGAKLLTGIEEVTPNPVTHLIYRHAHADHIGSARLLARNGVTIIAHELTARLVKDADDANRPLPAADRAVIELEDLAGLQGKEAAQVLGVTPGTGCVPRGSQRRLAAPPDGHYGRPPVWLARRPLSPLR